MFTLSYNKQELVELNQENTIEEYLLLLSSKTGVILSAFQNSEYHTSYFWGVKYDLLL
jgi:hypothetical protein